MPPTGNEIKFGGNFDRNLLMLMNSSMLLFILVLVFMLATATAACTLLAAAYGCLSLLLVLTGVCGFYYCLLLLQMFSSVKNVVDD